MHLKNSSIFASALRHNEGCGVEREVHYILGYGVFLKAIKLKKIKVKKLIFYLPESKEGVYLQPQKQRRFLIKTAAVLKFF